MHARSALTLIIFAFFLVASCKPRDFNANASVENSAAELGPGIKVDTEAYWGQFLEMENLKRQARIDMIEGHYNETDRCKTTRDLFETGAQIVSPDSLANGQCIDQSLFRTVRIVTDAQKRLLGFSSNDMVLANVHGMDQKGRNIWLLAVVEMDSLQDIYFQVLERKALHDRHHPSHSQMLARFSKPVRLYLQYNPQTHQPDTSRVFQEVTDLVLSVQAGHGHNLSKNLSRFFDGTYPLVYGVFTPQYKFWLGFVAAVDWAPVTRVPQVPIGRDIAEKRDFVMTYFEYGDRWNLATSFTAGGLQVSNRVFFYLSNGEQPENLGDAAAGFNMLQKSCSNSAFRIIDTVLRKRRSKTEQADIARSITLVETVPGFAWEGLAKRGLMQQTDAKFHPVKVDDYVSNPTFVEMVRMDGLALAGSRQTLKRVINEFDRRDLFAGIVP